MAADPRYDLQAELTRLMPGVVLQRQLLDAAAVRYASNGFVPLTSADVVPILALANTLDQGVAAYVPTDPGSYPAALPAYPAGLKRFADSNPSSGDDWSIERRRSVAA